MNIAVGGELHHRCCCVGFMNNIRIKISSRFHQVKTIVNSMIEKIRKVEDRENIIKCQIHYYSVFSSAVFRRLKINAKWSFYDEFSKMNRFLIWFFLFQKFLIKIAQKLVSNNNYIIFNIYLLFNSSFNKLNPLIN